MAIDGSSSEQGISIRWFFLPPFVAVFTVLIANMLGSGQRIPVDAALWGLTGLLFVILTVLYGLFIRQEFFSGLFPVQLIAQGLLLSPVALHLGAHMLQWVGVVMTICGAVVLLALYAYRARPAVFIPPSPSSGTTIAALPLPVAITDSEGNIVSVSDVLLKLTNQPRDGVEGEKITILLPLDEEQVFLGGKEWRIVQTPMSNNAHYFQLEEAHDTPTAVPPSRGEGDAFVESASTLYTRAYAAKRVVEELYRIRRYQRWMSAALLRMAFSYPFGASAQPAKEDEIFRAWCHFIKASTREVDISCLIRPRDVLIVMPETSLEAGRDVASKLADFRPYLQNQLIGFEGAAAIRSGIVFFGAGSGGFGFDEFLYKMDEALQET